MKQIVKMINLKKRIELMLEIITSILTKLKNTSLLLDTMKTMFLLEVLHQYVPTYNGLKKKIEKCTIFTKMFKGFPIVVMQ